MNQQREEQAKRLLSEPLLVEAFTELEQNLKNTWEFSSVGDIEAREQVWLSLRLLEKIRLHLTSLVETGEMAKKLELELQPFVDEEVDARAKIKSALAENNIPIDPQPGMKIDEIYTVLPKVHDAMVEWDLAQRNLVERQSDQVQYTNYWKKSVRPSLVSENAVPALSFIGPELQPFQVEWSLYGLTLGLVVGSLLMLVCWKLFP